MSANPFVRYQRLSGDRRRLLLRAVATLTMASVAVSLRPFRRTICFGSVPRGQLTQVSPEDVVWAVEAAARRIPVRTMCLEKGLATQRMLRTAGIDALLHYGARHEPASRDLEAHVWVTVDGQTVIGDNAATGFASVATFPVS